MKEKSTAPAANNSSAETPLIALITPEKQAPADLSAFLKTLNRLAVTARGAPVDLDIRNFDSFESFAKFLAEGQIPHLLLVEHDSFTPPKAKPKTMSPVFLELRRNDPNIAIFLFNKSIPDGTTLMHWMDAGVTAFLQRGDSGAHLDEALEELLMRRLASQYRRRLRVPHAHKLNVSFPSLAQALVAETLNIGTGGMFIQTKTREMKVGDVVEFTFTLDSGSSASQKAPTDDATRPDVLALMDNPSHSAGNIEHFINGTGKIVWVRSEASIEMPEGIGLQFLDLEANGQILLDDFVKKTGTHAFIPKA